MNNDKHSKRSGDEPLGNTSVNPTFDAVLAARLSRRRLLQGSLSAGTLAFFGVSLTGCGGGGSSDSGSEPPPANLLGFNAIPISSTDTLSVAAGYTAVAFAPWGTPLTGSLPPYLDGGLNSGTEQEQQVGMHHDGMHYFPIDSKTGGSSSTEGLLVINHEYIDPNTLHPNGPTVMDNQRVVTDEVRKEIAAHGVSVVHIRQQNGVWSIVTPSPFNRRITAGTPMTLSGPVAGSDFVKTLHSPDGSRTRGTLNNCANGYTPWNTYLTCEENWAGYFVNKDETLPREHRRYGVSTSTGRYGWETVTTGEDEYLRFNASTQGATATDDYRNEPNAFGWIVEIDPFDPNSTPVKRTALGRFAHESVAIHAPSAGKPIVAYSGDDSRFEYIYKFVSAGNYDAATANGSLLDSGTLYVAKFNNDGTGEWLALVFGQNGLTEANGFTSQADVLVNTRTAADLVGATKMDRPEWIAIHPDTADVYCTLTNNSRRTLEQVDGANPRGPNPYGHIIKWTEDSADYTGTTFTWDIFILSGTVQDSSGLTADNFHNSPDGLWFDTAGRLWIQTDGQYGEPWGNNQMLAADTATGELRRFFVGPLECEVTGITATPDRKTLFVNIQHPGEDGSPTELTSHWPDGGSARPRSSTVIITKDDGGEVGS